MSDVSLDGAKLSVLVENTGQTVLKNLRDLENRRSLFLSRWIWELLQNARDAASDGGISVLVSVEAGILRFAHNGRPFSAKEIAHLIYHGSTKQEDPHAIGQYGTGFLSTHQSVLQFGSGGIFKAADPSTSLSQREGDSAGELSATMDSSWAEFEESLGTCEQLVPPYTTTFEYPLAKGDTAEVIERGIDSLEHCAPYVLAFNANLRTLAISRNGSNNSFERSAKTDNSSLVRIVTTVNEESTIFAVALADAGPATVSVLLRESGARCDVVDASPTPKLRVSAETWRDALDIDSFVAHVVSLLRPSSI